MKQVRGLQAVDGFVSFRRCHVVCNEPKVWAPRNCRFPMKAAGGLPDTGVEVAR